MSQSESSQSWSQSEFQSQTREDLLPADRDAEAGVVGSLLIDNEVLLDLSDPGVLSPEDFHSEPLREMFAAAVALYADGSPVDLITLPDELTRRGRLEAVGGVSAVSAVANNVPSSSSALHYARVVRRLADQRRLIHAAGKIAAVAYRPERDQDPVAEAEKLLLAVTDRATTHDARPLSEALSDFMALLDARQDQARDGAVVGVPSLRTLDTVTGGFQRSDLIVLAARPAVGKTSLALSIAHAAALRHGRKVLVFSLEMSEEQLVARLVAMESGVDQQRMRLGRLTDTDMEALSGAVGRLSRGPGAILIDDTPGLSLAALRAKALKAALRDGVDMVVVDYLQLMSGPGGEGRRAANRQEEISAISRGLKALARELDVPVLALSQLSRAVEGRSDKTPMLSDLRESGAIEQDSDVVIFIHREEVYNPETDRPHIADIVFAKHRNGPTPTVELFFQAEQTRYRDLERRMVAPEDVYAGVAGRAPMPSFYGGTGDTRGDWTPGEED